MTKAVLIGLLAGTVIALPLSYYLQPGYVRAFVSLPGYLDMVLRSATDTLKGKGGGGGSPAQVVKSTVGILAVLGAMAGYAMARMPRRRPARAAATR